MIKYSKRTSVSKVVPASKLNLSSWTLADYARGVSSDPLPAPSIKVKLGSLIAFAVSSGGPCSKYSLDRLIELRDKANSKDGKE